MPANFESGFFVREPAWHGLGTVVDDYPGSWDEARKLAGLTWEPVSAPSFGYSGVNANGDVVYDPADAVTGEFFAVDGRQRIVRSDTGATLGVPTEWYQVITHAEMGEIVEAVLEQTNVKYETTISVNGGRQVASLVRLDEPITVPGDNTLTLPYMALTTRHDGTGALRAQSTSVRVVCANTFAAAEAQADRQGTGFTFSHSKNWREHVEEAKQAIRGVRTDFHAYAEFAEELAKTPVTREQTERFIVEFVPMPIESQISDRVARNREEARATIRQILAGPTCETIAGTAFGLVSAAGEFADHYRRYQNTDTYVTRTLLRPEPLKLSAVKLAREIAGV